MRQHELKRQHEEMIREQRAVALQMQQMQQAVEAEQRARELKDKHERAKQLALAPSGPVAAAAVARIPDEKVLVVVLAQGKLSQYIFFFRLRDPCVLWETQVILSVPDLCATKTRWFPLI